MNTRQERDRAQAEARRHEHRVSELQSTLADVRAQLRQVSAQRHALEVALESAKAVRNTNRAVLCLLDKGAT